MNPPFPDIDVEGFEAAPVRALFSLADIDESARANPEETLMGFLSLLITQLTIVTLFKRNMLLSNECCGVPLFANNVREECKQCGKEVVLRINPRIVSGPPEWITMRTTN